MRIVMQLRWAACFAVLCGALPLSAAEEKTVWSGPATLWTDPKDIASRDLLWGTGGKARAPHAGPYYFIEEDLDGNSPKFVVQDANGVMWKVKLGPEARPETVATRFVWALGYTTDEDYFVPVQRVEGMPAKLQRGAEFVAPDGSVVHARWERMERKKIGTWEWANNPFQDTRELNGLRVLMSLLNNYDLKDSQNAIYAGEPSAIFLISDIGATFGASGSSWPRLSGKGDLSVYSRTKFIKGVTGETVDFVAPAKGKFAGLFTLPPFPYYKVAKWFGMSDVPDVTGQRWIGKDIPREHARWMAELLSKLTSKQIRDAFRAGGYTGDEVEGFSRLVESRIAELSDL